MRALRSAGFPRRDDPPGACRTPPSPQKSAAATVSLRTHFSRYTLEELYFIFCTWLSKTAYEFFISCKIVVSIEFLLNIMHKDSAMRLHYLLFSYNTVTIRQNNTYLMYEIIAVLNNARNKIFDEIKSFIRCIHNIKRFFTVFAPRRENAGTFRLVRQERSGENEKPSAGGRRVAAAGRGVPPEEGDALSTGEGRIRRPAGWR